MVRPIESKSASVRLSPPHEGATTWELEGAATWELTIHLRYLYRVEYLRKLQAKPNHRRIDPVFSHDDALWLTRHTKPLHFELSIMDGGTGFVWEDMAPSKVLLKSREDTWPLQVGPGHGFTGLGVESPTSEGPADEGVLSH